MGNANLVGKVYFPRPIIPSSSAVVALVDFAINLALLLGLMAWYSFAPSWHVIFLPAVVVLAWRAVPAFLIEAFNVKYRDFRYIIPFIVQFGLYISQLDFRAPSCPKAGVSGTASTRWSALSTVSAGAYWAGTVTFICPGSCSAFLFLWLASPISAAPNAPLQI